MDTSRGTTEDRIAVLLGKCVIQRDTMTHDVWMDLISTYKEKLPLKWMRGFKTIREHLAREGNVDLIVPKRINALTGSSYKESDTFLNCLEVQWDFPSRWQDAPRSDSTVDFLQAQHILLCRKGCFYHLQTRWHPTEVWEEGYLSSAPITFFYEMHEAVLTALYVSEHIKKLWEYASTHGCIGHPAEVMMRRFIVAMSETASNVRGQYDVAVEIGTQMRQSLERITA